MSSPNNLVRELARTLADPYFARRLSIADAAAIVALLRAEAILSDLTVPVHGEATHPEDDLVLSAALSDHASVLCTRDKQSLALGAYESLVVLSPGQRVARLE